MSAVPRGDREDELLVKISGEDLLALEELARIGTDGQETEAVATIALRRGLAAELADAGLSRPAGDAPADGRPGSAMPQERDDPDSAESPRTQASPEPQHSRRRRLWSRGEFRAFVVALSTTVVLVLLVGGYADGWSWTGFAGNNQLWDWLHLLLLPIALGTFPLWLSYGALMSRPRKLVLAAVVLAFAGFVAAGYLAPLGWTGFQGNTLWDWLTLLVLPLALMTVRIWPSTRREIRAPHLTLGAALGLAWLVTLIGGYAGDWTWTGYPGNTLWDWISLLLGPVVITTIVIPAAVRWVSGDIVRIVAEETKHEHARPSARPAAAPAGDRPERSDRPETPRR